MPGVPPAAHADTIAAGKAGCPRLAERAHPRNGGAVALGLLRIEPLRHGLAVTEPLDPGIHLAVRDGALPEQPLLVAPEPALVVRRPQVVLGIHLLPDRAAAALPEPLDADDRRDREDPDLPRLGYIRSEPGVRTGPKPCMPPIS